MKKFKSMFFSLVICSLAFAAPVNSYPGNGTAAASEDTAAQSEAPPRWRSSLTEIDNVTTGLLEMNTKLSADYLKLSNDVISMQDKIAFQRQKNADLLLEFQALKKEVETPVDRSREKLQVAELEQSVARQKAQIDTLKTRLQAMDSKLDLQTLKLAGLELERKAFDLDREARNRLLLEGYKVEMSSLRDKIVFAQDQEKVLRGKIIALPGEEKPWVAEARRLEAQRMALQVKIEAAEAQSADLAGKIAMIQKKSDERRQSDRYARYKELEEEKAKLRESIDRLEEESADLQEGPARAARLVAMKSRLDDQQKDNTQVSDEVAYLRENIAILDFKVNSLRRYRQTQRN
jgi:chromosome segregation ATPase